MLVLEEVDGLLVEPGISVLGGNEEELDGKARLLHWISAAFDKCSGGGIVTFGTAFNFIQP